MSDNNFRFYKFIKLLLQESDEDHILTAKEIQNRMKELTGVSIDRRTIYDYVKTLKALDVDVSDYEENTKGYYLRNVHLERYEIRILMDCVTACQFITHKKTQELLCKLKKLGSRHSAEKYEGQLYIDNKSKYCNQEIYYAIDSIKVQLLKIKKLGLT